MATIANLTYNVISESPDRYGTGNIRYQDIFLTLTDTVTGLPVAGGGYRVNYQTSATDGFGHTTINNYSVLIYGTELQIFSGMDQDHEFDEQGNPTVIYDLSFSIISQGDEIPASCDLFITSIQVTQPTEFAGGTIKINATSSHLPIQYSLDNVTFQDSNIFTNVPGGAYTAYVTDEQGCMDDYPNIVLFAFGVGTHFKYRIKFKSAKTQTTNEIQFYDQYNVYDVTQYPKDLTLSKENGGKPVDYGTPNNGEKKDAPVIGKSLVVNVINNGVFSVGEFAFSDERKWFVKYLINGVLEFQGWVLPDEIYDQYQDPLYSVSIKATDGVASLKGTPFTDIDGNNYYGLYNLPTILDMCLTNLNYDYGDFVILSSLTAQLTTGARTADQWVKTLIWAELFYDSDGTPHDCYSILEDICNSFYLSLRQRHGKFYLISSVDISYSQAGPALPLYNSYIRAVNSTTEVQAETSLQLATQNIGFGQIMPPVNPPQNIRFDKALSEVKATIDLTQNVLVYENPDFEINPVEDSPPPGWHKVFTTDPFQFVGLKKRADAYSGDWLFLIEYSDDPVAFGENDEPGFRVDSFGKKVGLSFRWRTIGNDNPSVDVTKLVPHIGIMLVGDHGSFYYYNFDAENGALVNQWDIVVNEGDGSLVRQTPLEYPEWSSFGIETTALPDTGQLYIRIYGPGYNASSEFVNLFGTGLQIDEFQLTVFDTYINEYSAVTQETHLLNQRSFYSKSEKSELPLKLFTFANNKRLSGNVLFGTELNTAIVPLWIFALDTAVNNTLQKLPAAVVKQKGKNYQKPMVIFEGDLFTDDFEYSDYFLIDGYPNIVFQCASMSYDKVNSIVTVTLIQVCDDDFRFIYRYIPKFLKSVKSAS